MEITASASSWCLFGTRMTCPQQQFCPPSPSSSEKFLLKMAKFYCFDQGYASVSPALGRNYSLLFHQHALLQIHKKTPFQVFCGKQRETSVVEASCMEDIYDALAERLVPTAAAASTSNYKHIVGLAGPPGAGKSTIASEVAQRINKLWLQKCISFDTQVNSSEAAIVLPMDGFHLYRHQLDAMEDPEEAHARRGAPWTFDPELLLRCLKTLRDQGSVYAPSFHHGVGDPVEDDIFIDARHKVVIVEGNYVLLQEGVWKDISTMFDEKWFVDVDIEIAMQRVLKRHISTGKPPQIAKWRIDYNDRPNAELIMKSKDNADLVVKSVDKLS